MTNSEQPAAEDTAQVRPAAFNWMKMALAFMLLAITSAITLAFGLVPQDDYASKWVSASEQSSGGVAFGRYGIAHGDFPELTELHGTNNNLEFNLGLELSKPENSTFQVIAHLGEPNDPLPLIIGQWQTYLIVIQGFDFSNQEGLPRLTVNVEEWIGTPFELRILLNDNRNTMYLNGTPVSVHNPSTYVLEKPNLKIALGNTPNGRNGWTGDLHKFSVDHYEHESGETSPLVNYDLNANISVDSPDEAGTIEETVQNGYALTIPPVGKYPEKLFLNDRKVQNLVKSSPFDLFINLVGFMPIAMVMAFFLTTLWAKIPWWVLAPVTLAGCVAVSVAIEFNQQYIPSRNSDLHDLVLNTSGAVAGIIAFFILRKILLRPKPLAPPEVNITL